MPIKLNLKEKCYIAAVYGDMSGAKRKRLFSASEFPIEASAEMLADGWQFHREILGKAVAIRSGNINR